MCLSQELRPQGDSSVSDLWLCLGIVSFFDKLNMSSECSYSCLVQVASLCCVPKRCDLSHCTLFEVIIYALIVTGTPEPREKCFYCCTFNLNCFDTGIFYSVNGLEKFVAAQCRFNRFFSLVSFSLDGHIM